MSPQPQVEVHLSDRLRASAFALERTITCQYDEQLAALLREAAAVCEPDGVRYDIDTGTHVAKYTILTAGRTALEAKAALASAVQLAADNWPVVR